MMDNGTQMTMPVVPAYGGYGGNGGGFGFGGDNAWWIVLFLIFGWGNGGNWGNGGGMNGGVGSEVQRGFDHSATITKLDGVTTGIADATYALNNTLNNGFHGVDSALCNLGNIVQQGNNATQVAIMQGNNTLGAQISNCCCETREAIQGLRYDMATQACETRHAIQDGTRAILDNLNANYIRALESENQGLKLAASQAAQNAYLTATIGAGCGCNSCG